VHVLTHSATTCFAGVARQHQPAWSSSAWCQMRKTVLHHCTAWSESNSSRAVLYAPPAAGVRLIFMSVVPVLLICCTCSDPQLERFGLPEPEAVFSIGFFKKNPKPFHLLAKELFPGGTRWLRGAQLLPHCHVLCYCWHLVLMPALLTCKFGLGMTVLMHRPRSVARREALFNRGFVGCAVLLQLLVAEVRCAVLLQATTSPRQHTSSSSCCTTRGCCCVPSHKT
jgi:hypothetical protein